MSSLAIMLYRIAIVGFMLATFVASNRLLSELTVTIVNYGRSGSTLYGMVECCEGSFRFGLDFSLNRRTQCRSAQDQLTPCNNVVKVAIHPSAALRFTPPTNDPDLKKAAAMVNNALAVGGSSLTLPACDVFMSASLS